MIRIVSVVLTFLGGLYFFLEFLLPEEIAYGTGEVFKFGRYYQEVSLGVSLVSGVAVGLGVANILMVHGRILLAWKKGAFSSLSLLVFFFLSLMFQARVWMNSEEMSASWKGYDAVIYYVKQIKGEPTTENLGKLRTNLELLINDRQFTPEYVQHEDLVSTLLPFVQNELTTENLSSLVSSMSGFKTVSLKKADLVSKQNISSKIESLILKGMFFPLGMSMFSLLAFYIGYAAYRTFRVQSKEAFVMMMAALVIILGQIPQGANYISADLPELRFWIMEFLSTPAFRAIYFSSAIAGLGLAVRMWFSMEKNPF